MCPAIWNRKPPSLIHPTILREIDILVFEQRKAFEGRKHIGFVSCANYS